MSDEEHDHGDHDHDGHEHHHALSYEDELGQMREAATHYYQHQFDWKGHGPPEDFDGPRWFPVAPEFRLDAHLDRKAPGAGDQVELATSTGQLRHMENMGQLVFKVGGQEQRLTAFMSHAADGFTVLFVPFRDATSGTETYGAGRYVEAPFERDDPVDEPVELDFNFAYNPSCAFSPAYDCPFPPPGNRLSVAVTAGEMLPSGAAPH